MIGRIAWGLALTGLAALVAGAQLDRAARYDPALAALVPAPLRGFAAQRLTAAGLLERDGVAAATHARALIRARPLPAEHLVLLAQAAALQDRPDRAIAALEAASTRGWRDPLTQIAAATAALDAGQHQAAAQRMAALLATGLVPDETRPLLARLLATAQGRSAYAALLTAPGRWQENAFGPTALAAAPEDLAALLELVRAQEESLPCGWQTDPTACR